ncbi:hypothetical protein D3C86_1796250 [compost metagenome]
MNPVTPDGRYFVVKDQLWRSTNPSLSEDVRQLLINDLMAARRGHKSWIPPAFRCATGAAMQSPLRVSGYSLQHDG